jgi:hypothetical protein
MADCNKILIFFCISFNIILALGDRIIQIVYFSLTKFLNQTVSSTCLAFILITPLANILMMSLYLLSHNDFNIGVRTKIKYFFYYVLSAEACFSLGVHSSFKSKFSQYSDNIIVTKKVINAMHILFISLPQILIITVHSSSLGTFAPIDIASLFFSCGFIMWSIVYYVLCNVKETDFELELEELVN